jgi:uncharacterized repeat protein (TIGR01451 family)
MSNEVTLNAFSATPTPSSCPLDPINASGMCNITNVTKNGATFDVTFEIDGSQWPGCQPAYAIRFDAFGFVSEGNDPGNPSDGAVFNNIQKDVPSGPYKISETRSYTFKTQGLKRVFNTGRIAGAGPFCALPTSGYEDIGTVTAADLGATPLVCEGDDNCSTNPAACGNCGIYTSHLSYDITSRNFVPGGDEQTCDKKSAIGSSAIATVRVKESGNLAVRAISTMYHCSESGCGACDQPASNQTIDGDINYSPHSAGNTTFTWPLDQFNCGRVQFDAGWQYDNNAAEGDTFIGEVVDYGVPCGGSTGTPPPETPTPTPFPQVSCSAVVGIISIGQPATFNVSGGTGVYAWFSADGIPGSGTGPTFNPVYSTVGLKTVVVDGGSGQAVCSVTVIAPTPTPTPSASPSPSLSPSSSPSPSPSASPSASPSPSLSPSPTPGPALSIQKTVRNITQNSAESDNVSANPSDIVEFLLRSSSTGGMAATVVVNRDALPSGLSYLPGSTTIDGTPAADGVISTGIVLGDMYSGRTIAVRFRATVAPASFFAPGTSVLTNTGFSRASNVPEVSDTAFVTVVSAPQGLSLSLTKLGRNITRGETIEHSPVSISPAQTIEFTIRARNTSAAVINDVVLRDIMPQGVSFIAGSVRIGGVTASDAFISSGIPLGTLAPNQEVVIVFSGRVASSVDIPVGTTTVINTSQATGSGIGTITAQLPIIITNGAIIPPVPTGPGESTVLALIISAIITLLYVGYTSTATYRRHEVGEIVKDTKKDKDLFNFRR